jgi:2-dehydropantoate 2-reductase
MSKALHGVRILDFTHVQSGPTCTQLLAWFGADVIKVEKAGAGDVTREQLRDIPDVVSLYFTMLNHNKRSVTLDTKSESGKQVLEKLVKHCDVLVENFARGDTENTLKIAIIGVGAIGGYLGTRLAHAGNEVTFIARGANLDALRTRGIRLILGDGSELAVPHVAATDDYGAAGPQDVVVLAMKAHQVEAVAPLVPKLFGPDTLVVPMQNGIPYWYFHRHPGELEGTQVKSVDPNGIIERHIPCGRVIGCVVYPAAELISPGVIKHVEGNRFPVGEPDGSSSDRVNRLAQCFVEGGLQAPVLDDIRGEVWLKLWGNLTFNPISALSRATLAGICQYPLSRTLARAMMTEAQSVANKLGVTFRVALEKRIAGAERVGHHKTSMLQDVEAGRTLEIDALLGSVVELARLTDTPTPHLDTVHALTKLLGKSLEDSKPQLDGPR